MSAAFRRLPGLVCGAARARGSLSGLRTATRPTLASSWSEWMGYRGVVLGRHFVCNQLHRSRAFHPVRSSNSSPLTSLVSTTAVTSTAVPPHGYLHTSLVWLCLCTSSYCCNFSLLISYNIKVIIYCNGSNSLLLFHVVCYPPSSLSPLPPLPLSY